MNDAGAHWPPMAVWAPWQYMICTCRYIHTIMYVHDIRVYAHAQTHTHTHTAICRQPLHLSFQAWQLVPFNTPLMKDSPSCMNQKLIEVCMPAHTSTSWLDFVLTLESLSLSLSLSLSSHSFPPYVPTPYKNHMYTKHKDSNNLKRHSPLYQLPHHKSHKHHRQLHHHHHKTTPSLLVGQSPQHKGEK